MSGTHCLQTILLALACFFPAVVSLSENGLSVSPYLSCSCCLDHSLRCCPSFTLSDFSSTRLLLTFFFSSSLFFLCLLCFSRSSATRSLTERFILLKSSTFQWYTPPLLCKLMRHVCLQKAKIGCNMVVGPLHKYIFLPERNEHIERALQPIGVAT